MRDTLKTEVPSLPANPAGLLDWLAEKGKRLKELQGIVCAFLETGDTGLLAAFSRKEDSPPALKLTERIGGAVTLFDHKAYVADNGETALKERNEDIKRLFPNVEIREVQAANGKTLLAYIGVEPEVCSAGRRMCQEQRSLTKDVQRGKEKLAACLTGSERAAELLETVSSGSAIVPLPTPPRTGTAARVR